MVTRLALPRVLMRTLTILIGLVPHTATLSSTHSLLDVSILELGDMLVSRKITSSALVDLYTERIHEVNAAVRAVIELDADAALTAARLDAEFDGGILRGPLHGIPILVKDNLATVDGTSTGAGSVCLARWRPGEEATVVSRLRRAGAVILGKTNLSEFSGVRGRRVPDGWSARGGQTRGAYVLGQTACGSSSGSGVAAALGLAAATVGTETGGSITCPAMVSNVVGVKPTVGLTSRFGVVPITARQDTVGPLARTVADAAVLLDAMAGRDDRDNYTLAMPWKKPPSFAAALNVSALEGKRIGVVRMADADWEPFYRSAAPNRDHIRLVFDAALEDLRAAGAELVDVRLDVDGTSMEEKVKEIRSAQSAYVGPDFNAGMTAYLHVVVPDASGSRNLSDLYRCLQTDPLEQAGRFSLSDWDRFANDGRAAGTAEYWHGYRTASESSRRMVVRPMKAHGLDALVMVPELALSVAAAPGMPVITVPMGALDDGAETRWDEGGTLIGTAPGMPLGLSFTADRWTDDRLVGFAYAYEQVSRNRPKLQPVVKPRADLNSMARQVKVDLR